MRSVTFVVGGDNDFFVLDGVVVEYDVILVVVGVEYDVVLINVHLFD